MGAVLRSRPFPHLGAGFVRSQGPRGMWGFSMRYNETPVTWGDLERIFPTITMEIVAACTDASDQMTASALADQRLTDIANRLLDVALNTTDRRAAALITALAQRLIATEEAL